MKKAKVKLELNIASNTKNNNKDFYRYVNKKIKVKEGKLQTINKLWESSNNGGGED